MGKPKKNGRKIQVGTASLFFAVSWIILGSRNMPVDFMSDTVWYWLNTIIGWGGLITLIVLMALGKIKLVDDGKNDVKEETINKLIASVTELVETIKNNKLSK